MKHAKPPHQVDSHTDDRDISPTAQYDKPQATDLKHQATQNSSHTSDSFEIPATQAAKQAPAVQDAARDSNPTGDSFEIPNTQAEGFADDFGGFQGGGAGIYLGDNEQAHRAESTKTSEAVQGAAEAGFFSKSAAKPTRKAESNTPKANAQGKAPRLCGCVEFIYTGKEPYTLRLTSGESFSLKPKEHFIIPRGTLSRWCEYKTTLFKKN